MLPSDEEIDRLDFAWVVVVAYGIKLHFPVGEKAEPQILRGGVVLLWNGEVGTIWT